MKRYLRFAALLGLFAMATPAIAGSVSISGSIDGTEPTFDNPDTVATTLTAYDTYEFTVGSDGMYSFLSSYPGDASLDENMDGFLLLYTGAFDPVSGTSTAFDDDYSAGDVAALAGFDAACVGQNCSGFEIALTAGTTYVLVQTTFTDVANSFGQPTGAYDLTITGPGDINVGVIPIPAAVWLMASGLLGLAGLRRRS